MDKIIELLRSNNFQISKSLLFNYKKLNILDNELIVLIYLINENVYNPKQISIDLNIAFPEVLETINNLTEKGLLKIDLAKINNIRTEVVNLDLLYDKLAFLIIKKEDEEKPTSLFDTFEQELGRTLSPMEYEIINGWLSTCNEEVIILALKEAIYNGVSNFRYIDRIINEWNKKGIKSKEDVEKNRKEFKKNQKSQKNQELFDYDWLNDEGNN